MMDFRKKLKIRLWTAIAYMIVGAAVVLLGILLEWENTVYSSVGIALFVVGVARIRRHIAVTKSEERMRKQEILETDERNIYVMNKAKSIACSLYLLIGCVAVIVLEIMQKTALAQVVFACLMVLVVIYWITYWIVRKKS